MTQYTASILIATALCFVALMRPRAAIVLGLIYLALLGDLRRMLMYANGPLPLDPMLLVAPALVGTLALRAYQEGRVRADTALAKAVGLCIAVMLLQMLNPAQGGLSVGVGGALFYIVPLLWFWVGRAYGSLEFAETLVTRVVLPLAIVAALLGVYQNFSGFLAYQQYWVDYIGSTYAALDVSGRIRPFSFFTSSVEYAQWLSVAIVTTACLMLGSGAVRFTLLALPFLLAAMMLQGSRGVVVATLFAIAAGWSLRSASAKAWVPRMLIGLAITAFLFKLALTQTLQYALPEEVSSLVERHSAIFAPFSSESSTASSHLNLRMGALQSILHTPMGYGLGSTTLAAAKMGSGGASSETDIGDMFIALGVVGGPIYLLVVYRVIAAAIGHWRRTRSATALMVIGALVAQFGVWLMGGHYAVAALIWLLIGSLDHDCRPVLAPRALVAERRVGRAPAERTPGPSTPSASPGLAVAHRS